MGFHHVAFAARAATHRFFAEARCSCGNADAFDPDGIFRAADFVPA